MTAGPTGATGSILVVDDEPQILALFASLLAEEGYRVVTAPGFDEALAALRGESFDMVYLDITLEGRNTGLDLLRPMRETDPSCPVVVITGNPSFDTAATALREEAFDYIPKPIRREELLRTTRIALEHRRLLREREIYRSNLEAIFTGLRDLVVLVDDRLVVVEVNGAGRPWSLDREALRGRPFREALPCVFGVGAEMLEETLRNGSLVDRDGIDCRDPGGAPLVLSISTTPVRDTAGKITGAILVARDQTRLTDLERTLGERRRFHGLVGNHPAMQEIYTLIERLAEVETTVLLTGESGTGKELVAEAIHHTGARREGPLVKVNCSALSESLLESELFGHVKGSFTGAHANRRGRFEAANHGTIFLDEIGDVSPALQLRLLRVLQSREIEPVGDSTTRRIDVRVIAATNRDLPRLVAAGKFREDLFYRLNVVEVHLPPLRDRRTDIPLLTEGILERLGPKLCRQGARVTGEAMDQLLSYSWPGNVRQLEHALEHALVFSRSGSITPADLPPEIRAASPARLAGDGDRERERLLRVIEEAGGNRTRAARRLGMSRRTFYRRLEEHGILPAEGEAGS